MLGTGPRIRTCLSLPLSHSDSLWDLILQRKLTLIVTLTLPWFTSLTNQQCYFAYYSPWFAQGKCKRDPETSASGLISPQSSIPIKLDHQKYFTRSSIATPYLAPELVTLRNTSPGKVVRFTLHPRLIHYQTQQTQSKSRIQHTRPIGTRTLPTVSALPITSRTPAATLRLPKASCTVENSSVAIACALSTPLPQSSSLTRSSSTSTQRTPPPTRWEGRSQK